MISLAWQVICILGELGRKVPEQCSVVGFDNIKYPYPVHLTSVSSSKTTMAKKKCGDPAEKAGGTERSRRGMRRP